MTPEKLGRVFVAGHRGLVGSAIVRALAAAGVEEPLVRTRDELDLMDQKAVHSFFRENEPDTVFFAAAKVGGIAANNDFRWDFIYQNMVIEANVLGAAMETGAKDLVFFGSSCIYPKLAPQPISEGDLLTGTLEQTNEPYAIAKIAGLKLVEAANAQFGKKWLSLMPTNLYGPNDNYDLKTSHVLPALIRKFHEAAEQQRAGEDAVVKLWGTGAAKREFLHVDDAALAAISLLESGATGLYNVGSGSDQSIRDLAVLIASIVDYRGEIEWDASKPDGTPRKWLDSTKIQSTGWRPSITLEEGIRRTYEDYRSAQPQLAVPRG